MKREMEAKLKEMEGQLRATTKKPGPQEKKLLEKGKS